MKKIIVETFAFACLFCLPHDCFSQQQPAYKVPDTYSFDYEVVQQMKGGHKSDPQLINYYYTQDGNYMGIRPDSKKTGFLIYTKDGLNIIIDDDKKTITVLSLRNLIGDMSSAYAGMNKNNASASPKPDSSKKIMPVKTGNTKMISGYTAEEYKFTDSKGETVTVWCAKVDFNASLFYLMGMGSSPNGRPGMGKYPQSQSYPSFNDPHLLLAETRSDKKPDEEMTTQSISKKTITINTKGYAITNLSNMGLKEMMEMKAKQSNPN